MVLNSGTSPWLGHSPWTTVKMKGDRIEVWRDPPTGSGSPEPPITFTRRGFAAALQAAARDLSDFKQALRHWLDLHAPAQAEALVPLFGECFDC